MYKHDQPREELNKSFREGFELDVFTDNYVLIIGPEVILKKTPDAPDGDINKYLLSIVNASSGKNYSSFTDITANNTDIDPFKEDPIKSILNTRNFVYDTEDMEVSLKSLLRTKRFKMVLTTTVDGYLEALMREIWGDSLRVVNIWDKSSMDEFGDALSKYGGRKPHYQPTLFYVFGKAVTDNGSVPKPYVNSDKEAIKVIERWMYMQSQKHPAFKCIQGKKILALGCKFDDWFFRFFLYVIIHDFNLFHNGEVAFIPDLSDKSDTKLRNFLKRMKVHNHGDAREIMTKMAEVLKGDFIAEFRDQRGVFISYTSRDGKDAAQWLFAKLISRDIKTWIDEAADLPADNYNKAIPKAIDNAAVFIPILTKEIINDLKAVGADTLRQENPQIGHYYFDTEWTSAKNAAAQGKCRILPLATDGVSLRDRETSRLLDAFFGDISGMDLEESGLEKVCDRIQQLISKRYESNG